MTLTDLSTAGRAGINASGQYHCDSNQTIGLGQLAG